MGDERDFLRKKYITAKGNWDLYIPFFERALNLTKPNAIIALISPNKWLSIDYAKNLRKMVYKQIEEIYDFSRFKSFDSANISAITTFFDKLEIDNIKTIRFNKDFDIESECTVNKREIEQYDNIGITLSENYKLLLKMMKDKDLLGGEDHFILENPASTSEAYELINIIEDGNYELLENEYFKFINTGTIDKFESLWGKKEIAYLGLDYKYPIVSKEKLKQKFPNRFNQACQPKLITTGIRYFEVFYDDLGEYLAGKSTIIIFSNKNYSIKWLLPILNSSLIYFYLKETYNALAMGGGVNYSTSNLGLIPLPKLSEENILKLEEITNSYNSNEKAYQCNLDDIDKFIYELYELTDQEIKIIEKFKEKQGKRKT